MSNDDLTARRIDAQWRSFFAELSSIYQRCREPKPGFWPLYDAEEPLVVAKLKVRPLPLSEIEATFGAFRAKLLKAL